MIKSFFRRLVQKRAIRRATKPIRESKFFNESFYLEQNPDVRESGMDAALHYLLHGGSEGRNPSPHFDTLFYLEQYPDVKASGMNPLFHYLTYGEAEHRLVMSPPFWRKNQLPTAAGESPSWSVAWHLPEDVANRSLKVNYLDETIKNNDYGDAIAHWETEIQAFWRLYIDRYYEFFVLSKKMRRGQILDVGAEFYNKYIKEVIAHGQTLTVVDLKEPDHPDIQIVKDLDHYHRFDMTRDDYQDFPTLAGQFDTVLSFGVLSYYDFSPDMCSRYIDNMVGFMKPDGMAIFKVDRHAIEKHQQFPAFSVLHQWIADMFCIKELDVLASKDQAFYIYYCSKKTPPIQA